MTLTVATDTARATGHALAIAGLTKLSTCDWPGHLVATLFLQGCPWRCTYCHNPGILDPTAPGQVAWAEVIDLLHRRRGLLDAVVFSGGEPTRQDLTGAMREVRYLGFGIGLHTAGAYPRRLAAMLPLVDWVGLDIKALPCEYPAITGVAASAAKAHESLRMVLEAGVDHEVRITLDPDLHTDEGVIDLVERLQHAGVRTIVLQEARLARRPARPPLAVLTHPPDGVTVRAG